jgi:hypothetical protein
MSSNNRSRAKQRPKRKVNLSGSNYLSRSNLTTTPGNPNMVLVLPELVGISTASASTTFAGNTTLNAGLLTNFATRFTLFDEYRILKFKFYMYPTSTGNGYASVYVDPLNSANPTSTTAQTNVSRMVPLSAQSAKGAITFVYNVSDFALLSYQPISTTTFAYGYFKVYTDAANYGNTLASGALIITRCDVTVEFRGLS